jgi:hypothetical protein
MTRRAFITLLGGAAAACPLAARAQSSSGRPLIGSLKRRHPTLSAIRPDGATDLPADPRRTLRPLEARCASLPIEYARQVASSAPQYLTRQAAERFLW